MPNQIMPEYEMIIYNYIRDYPNHGPARITNELQVQGINISPGEIYNVLKRKGLNQCLDRLFYVEKHSDNPVITERYLREVEKKKETHIQAFYPGYHISQNIFYVGSIKLLGRIYQQSGSNFGFAKVYLDKKAYSGVHPLD